MKTMNDSMNEFTLKSNEMRVLIDAKLVTDKIAIELHDTIRETKKYIRMVEQLPINHELKKEIACQVINNFYKELHEIADMI